MIELEYAYKVARNGTQAIAYEVVEGEENIFDFMLFIAAKCEKATRNFFTKDNMKTSYKMQHKEPKDAEGLREFCLVNEYTFGLTCYCGIKDDFTTGFSVIKPWNIDVLIFTTYLDESAVDIEQKLAEILHEYNQGGTECENKE